MRRNILLLLAFFFSLQTSYGYGQSFQYENKIVDKINVIISTPVSGEVDSASLKTRLKTREGDVFSQTAFDSDLKALATDYDRVIPEITIVNEKLEITLKVWLKPTIRSIGWTGNKKIKTKDLQKELEMALCSVFDRQSFNKAFHKLKAYYVKEGFFEAQLEYNVTLDESSNEVDIEISIAEGRAGRIKRIEFCGFTKDEKQDLLEMIVTKEYSFFTSWLTNEGTYNEDAIQQDQFVIINYLQNEGYADAQVKINVVDAGESNRIIIQILADRGPKYTFGPLTFEGNCIFTDAEIRRRFIISEGKAYSPDKIRETVDSITKLYGRFGYIDANVNFEPQLSCDEHIYTVHFKIEEGEQFRVGLVKVFGNCSTQTKVILHETLLVPGEVFNTEKMESTEERLKNVGYFKNVNVYAVRSDDPSGLGDNYRDVHIEVEETSTGHFGASFGFSTVESIFGSVNVTENNFNYRGLGRVWSEGYKALRGGGEYAHITATVGKKSTSYVLSWTKPYFNDTQWSVGFDAEASTNSYISNDYEIKAAGITFHADYQVNPFVRFGWHYRLRNTWVHLEKKHRSQEERKEAHVAGLISATGVSWAYDSSDHPLRPTKGFKSRFEIEYAGLGGDHTFFSFAYLNTYYIPIGRDGVLKYRGDVKFIQPVLNQSRRRIPLDERLFLGGDWIIRGFRSYKLGPVFSEGKDPKGGMSLQMISWEYTHRFMKRLDGFVFCDAGHLSFENWNFGRLYTAVGFGAKIQVFEGGPPLMVGLGFPINPKYHGQVKKFFLTIGGRF